MGFDGSGWAEDDPEYLMARIGAIVDNMSRWRGRPLAVIEGELHRRLSVFGGEWPPELIEHLARRIGDPHWPWKHPLQALDLSRRYNARARTCSGGPEDLG